MTLAAAAEANFIFTIMGRPMLQLRECAVALDKWRMTRVSHHQILGLMFDTRAMTIGIVSEYRAAVLKLLRRQFKRSTFTVGDMESLIGKLRRIGQAFLPIYHLMPHMYSSVAYALRENTSFLMSTSRHFRALMK